MAVAKQRARVRDSEITEDIWIRLNYLLRCPLQGIVSVFLNWPRELEHFAEDDCGQLVISRIIPAISLLRQQHRITFSTLFSEDLLAEKIISPTNLSVLSMDLDVSADLDDSDFLFNAITAKCGEVFVFSTFCLIFWQHNSQAPRQGRLEKLLLRDLC